MIEDKNWRKNFILVAPSWVIPAGIEENAKFLSGRVDEVSLCFFELQSSLAYTEKDLPKSLASLPLSWQVHLPFDLPSDAHQAFEFCVILLSKISFLSPVACVLHPFTGVNKLKEIRTFIELWKHSEARMPELWLENTDDDDLIDLLELVYEFDIGICFDLGHALAYNQAELINSITTQKKLIKRIKQLHLSVIDKKVHASKHLEIPDIDDEKWGKSLTFLKPLLKSLSPFTRIQPEIFNWQKYLNSVNILNKYFD